MRVVTRGDLDGAVCTAILMDQERVDGVLLLHPQDINRPGADIRAGDTIANLPFHPSCDRWFGHHPPTPDGHSIPDRFEGRFGTTPSAAQLVWEYFGKQDRWSELVAEVNRLDSGDLTLDDVLDPQGYILLGLTLDSRSGLGAYHYYFLKCAEWLKDLSVDRILQIPDVSTKTYRLRAEKEDFLNTLRNCSRIDGSVIVTDLRDSFFTPVGNRFLVYTLWPDAMASIRLHWGPDRESVIAAVAHSVLNRSCDIHIGELMAKLGGGGREGAGTAPLSLESADDQIRWLLESLQKND